MKNYPVFNIDPRSPRFQDEVIKLLEYILKERTNDVNDFINLQNRFMSGRKVGTMPTGASDVSDSDRVGDFNVFEDGGTFYYVTLVDNSGTAEWRRTALSSW